MMPCAPSPRSHADDHEGAPRLVSDAADPSRPAPRRAMQITRRGRPLRRARKILRTLRLRALVRDARPSRDTSWWDRPGATPTMSINEVIPAREPAPTPFSLWQKAKGDHAEYR